jgi:hypothetical protein
MGNMYLRRVLMSGIAALFLAYCSGGQERPEVTEEQQVEVRPPDWDELIRERGGCSALDLSEGGEVELLARSYGNRLRRYQSVFLETAGEQASDSVTSLKSRCPNQNGINSLGVRVERYFLQIQSH